MEGGLVVADDYTEEGYLGIRNDKEIEPQRLQNRLIHSFRQG
jgi:hypothetical protein